MTKKGITIVREEPDYLELEIRTGKDKQNIHLVFFLGFFTSLFFAWTVGYQLVELPILYPGMWLLALLVGAFLWFLYYAYSMYQTPRKLIFDVKGDEIRYTWAFWRKRLSYHPLTGFCGFTFFPHYAGAWGEIEPVKQEKGNRFAIRTIYLYFQKEGKINRNDYISIHNIGIMKADEWLGLIDFLIHFFNRNGIKVEFYKYPPFYI